MISLYKRSLDAILSQQGQVLLLILILAAGILVRFCCGSKDVDLTRLTFAISSAPFQGRVVYSDVSHDLYLVLTEDKLYWREGEENTLLANAVVNVLIQDHRFWLKTETQVTEFILDGHYLMPELAHASLVDLGASFAQAHLVGKGEHNYYLRSGLDVIGIDSQGMREGPFDLYGRRSPNLVEGDWRRGVVFVGDKSWRVYTNFIDVKEGPLLGGKLREAILSPDASHLVYAIQADNLTEIWHAQASGAGAELIYEWEMEFSDIEALWSPDHNLLAISVLGFQGEAGFGDEFHSATFLYQSGQDIRVLSESNDREIKALVPTAWDVGAQVVWFNWLHEEAPTPISYRLIP